MGTFMALFVGAIASTLLDFNCYAFNPPYHARGGAPCCYAFTPPPYQISDFFFGEKKIEFHILIRLAEPRKKNTRLSILNSKKVFLKKKIDQFFFAIGAKGDIPQKDLAKKKSPKMPFLH